MVKRRSFTSRFKAQVLLEILNGATTQAEVAREHRFKPALLTRWKRHLLKNAGNLFERSQTNYEAGVPGISHATGE